MTPSPAPDEAVPAAAPTGDGTAARGRTGIRCRAIEESDLDAVIALLGVGFADRPARYWRTGLARHRAQTLPAGVPRYGYLLEHGGAPVGVLLALYRTIDGEAGPHLRCNLSSWFVLPAFRGMGTLLDGYAMRDKSVTYTNVSPAPHTRRMHEARGFKSISSGQTVVLPLLARPWTGYSVRRASPERLGLLPAAEARLVSDHLSYGCLGLVCTAAGGTGALVFQYRAFKLMQGRADAPGLPGLQLVYRSPNLDLSACLGTVGRHLLLRHAMPWFLLDADGRAPGIPGRFFPGRTPKYACGPNPPIAGDLSYSEVVLFGV